MFYSEKIVSCGRDQKTKNIRGKSAEAVLPSSTPDELAHNFSNSFNEKIDGIRNNISSKKELQTGAVTADEITLTKTNKLLEFASVSQNEVNKKLF